MSKALGNLMVGLFAAFLAACNPMEQLEGADAAVATFHQQMGSGQFEAIWDNSHKDFRASGQKEPALAFLASVSERMGPVKSTSRQAFNLNTDNGVTKVKVTHQTEFANGSATETFDFIRRGEKLELWNYNINWGTGQGSAEPAE